MTIEYYAQNIIKPELKRLKEAVENSKNEMEKKFWENRYVVQRKDFADALYHRSIGYNAKVFDREQYKKAEEIIIVAEEINL